ncbi:MAG: DUF5680 domain-containing protein [Pseudomonadota bacterium]
MIEGLESFIVAAKSATYVGEGAKVTPSRPGAFDLIFEDGAFAYRDSYFGGTDFVGQEVVWHQGIPVWAMNYYGRILRNDLIDGAKGADVIRAALTQMYAENRFLGGFEAQHDGYLYTDRSDGTVEGFTGVETIWRDGILAYQLDYHGGMIVP